MNPDINPLLQAKLQEYHNIRCANFDVVAMLSSYLNNNARFITKELVQGVVSDCGISDTYAFVMLLLAACGLDSGKSPRDALLEQQYFFPSVKKLNPLVYSSNPYYQNIKIPVEKVDKWELYYDSYKPYEAFIYNDFIVTPEFREIPRLGFFDTDFKFPAVRENGTEWMAIKPNEVETMQAAIDEVCGNVVVLGLGLGYFAYMASQKPDVKVVTIVEKDSEVIELFQEYILPQFEHKVKVVVRQADAFDFVKNQLPALGCSYVFVDLWHDVSDGFDMYLMMKKLEYGCASTKFLYWIEESLLSHLRWLLFDQMYNFANADLSNVVGFNRRLTSAGQVEHFLSSDFLRKMAAGI